jgi:hypothetical protein
MDSRVFVLSFVCLLLYTPSATALRAEGVTIPLYLDGTRMPAWMPLAFPPFVNGRKLQLLLLDLKCVPAPPLQPGQNGGRICPTRCRCELTIHDCKLKEMCKNGCGSCNCGPTCDCVCTTCGKVGDCGPVPRAVPMPAPTAAVASKEEHQAYQQAYRMLCQLGEILGAAWCRCPKLPMLS